MNTTARIEFILSMSAILNLMTSRRRGGFARSAGRSWLPGYRFVIVLHRCDGKVAYRLARRGGNDMEEPSEEMQKQQEFLVLVMEASKTGDKTKLAEWWREHFPGYKLWLIGPDCTGDEQ